jgi:hypothetical protein
LGSRWLVTNKRRLILFRRLGARELSAARLMRLFGFEIRFLEPVGAFRTEAGVEALQRSGFVWLKASELAGIDVFAPIAAGHRLVINVIDRFFPPAILEALGSVMPHPASDRSTLRILLYELVRGYLMPHGLALTVARLLQEQGYRVWLWQQDALMLKLARPGVRNLHPGLLSLAVRLAGRLFGRLSRRSSTNAAAKPIPLVSAPGAPADTAEVLYFPHQGPFYSDLFAKNQYYSKDPASPFHQDRMCHVELAEEMAPNTRITVANDYRRAGITVHWLPRYDRTRVSPIEFFKLALRIGPVAALLGLVLRQRLGMLDSQLRAFPRAKLALLGYESLFPRTMAAALQARGIVVAAAQERFVQPFHPGFHLILDHYLMHGEQPARAIRANSLCRVGDIAITGDLRQPQPSKVRRPGPHRCLVLDYHSASSPFADAFAIANGWASNRVFLEDILQLSGDFPEVVFTIRSKDSSWIGLPVFRDIIRSIADRPNLTVDQDRSLDRSYALLADSDSVVARHTSLGDQALALGMPVLFHERMAIGDRSIAAVMDYSPYQLLTRSYAELHRKFSTILRDGNILNAEQIASLRRDFYAQPVEVDPKKKAAAILGSILTNAQGAPFNNSVSLSC